MTAKSTAATPPSGELLRLAEEQLYDAECALHAARQTHVDAWIAAAADRLHDAIRAHLRARRTTAA